MTNYEYFDIISKVVKLPNIEKLLKYYFYQLISISDGEIYQELKLKDKQKFSVDASFEFNFKNVKTWWKRREKYTYLTEEQYIFLLWLVLIKYRDEIEHTIDQKQYDEIVESYLREIKNEDIKNFLLTRREEIIIEKIEGIVLNLSSDNDSFLSLYDKLKDNKLEVKHENKILLSKISYKFYKYGKTMTPDNWLDYFDKIKLDDYLCFIYVKNIDNLEYTKIYNENILKFNSNFVKIFNELEKEITKKKNEDLEEYFIGIIKSRTDRFSLFRIYNSGTIEFEQNSFNFKDISSHFLLDNWTFENDVGFKSNITCLLTFEQKINNIYFMYNLSLSSLMSSYFYNDERDKPRMQQTKFNLHLRDDNAKISISTANQGNISFNIINITDENKMNNIISAIAFLISIYNENLDMLDLILGEDFINVPEAKEEGKKTKSKNKTILSDYPLYFPTGSYRVTCQGTNRIPNIITKEDFDKITSSEERLKYLKYPTDKIISLFNQSNDEFEGKRLNEYSFDELKRSLPVIYFKANPIEGNKYKYPGVVKIAEKNHYVPCSFEQNQFSKTKSRTSILYNDDTDELPGGNIGNTGIKKKNINTHLENETSGNLDPVIANILPQQLKRVARYGIEQDGFFDIRVDKEHINPIFMLERKANFYYYPLFLEQNIDILNFPDNEQREKHFVKLVKENKNNYRIVGPFAEKIFDLEIYVFNSDGLVLPFYNSIYIPNKSSSNDFMIFYERIVNDKYVYDSVGYEKPSRDSYSNDNEFKIATQKFNSEVIEILRQIRAKALSIYCSIPYSILSNSNIINVNEMNEMLTLDKQYIDGTTGHLIGGSVKVKNFSSNSYYFYTFPRNVQIINKVDKRREIIDYSEINNEQVMNSKDIDSFIKFGKVDQKYQIDPHYGVWIYEMFIPLSKETLSIILDKIGNNYIERNRPYPYYKDNFDMSLIRRQRKSILIFRQFIDWCFIVALYRQKISIKKFLDYLQVDNSLNENNYIINFENMSSSLPDVDNVDDILSKINLNIVKNKKIILYQQLYDNIVKYLYNFGDVLIHRDPKKMIFSNIIQGRYESPEDFNSEIGVTILSGRYKLDDKIMILKFIDIDKTDYIYLFKKRLYLIKLIGAEKEHTIAYVNGWRVYSMFVEKRRDAETRVKIYNEENGELKERKEDKTNERENYNCEIFVDKNNRYFAMLPLTIL